MTEHEDCFKCRDCKYMYRCSASPDGNTCFMFASKKEVRLPIEEQLFDKIAFAESGEPITFSPKEEIILLEMLHKDILNKFKNEQ